MGLRYPPDPLRFSATSSPRFQFNYDREKPWGNGERDLISRFSSKALEI